MKAQNQIKRTLSGPVPIEYIRQLLQREEIAHRTDLARRTCQQFGFYDISGKLQISGCLKALRELESAGHFKLPKAQQKAGQKTPRRLMASAPLPVDVPTDVTAIDQLELVLVRTGDQMRLWNELMITEHPLKDGPLVGRQIRYLIRSAHGWLGGFGFAAPALQLSDRDQWIGWSREQCRTHLHHIVGMSRFLIRPSVNCKNLASKVLGMSVARLPDDFEQKYGYRPLLIESFVDTGQYSGACYRAANWLEIGTTKGRGRQDRYTRSRLSRKAIYLYVLEKSFRQQLGLLPDAGLGALDLSQGLESEYWAENEFGGAPVGDKRLSARLGQSGGCSYRGKENLCLD